jgi:uncharacterized RmlC-like cupin family protein
VGQALESELSGYVLFIRHHWATMNMPAELLKAADIAKMEGQTKAHLLNPEATRISKSLGRVTGLTSLGFQLMTIMPGREYAEYYRHLYEEQCFYVLSGRGERCAGRNWSSISNAEPPGNTNAGRSVAAAARTERPCTQVVARHRPSARTCVSP